MNNSNKMFRQLKIFIMTIRLIWNASHRHTVIICILNLMVGFFAPLNMIIYKHLLDSLASDMASHIIQSILYLCVLWAIGLIHGLITKVNSYFQQIQSDYINLHTTDIILTKIIKLDMDNFDNPETYNKIRMITSEATSRSKSVLDKIILILRSAISLLGVVSVLVAYYSVWSIFIIFIALTPLFIVGILTSKKMHGIFEGRIEKLRLIDALSDIMIKYNYIKEIKIFNCGQYLKKMILSINAKYVKENSKIGVQNTKKTVLAELVEYITILIMKILLIIHNASISASVGTIIIQIGAIDSVVQHLKTIITTGSSMYNDNLYIESLYEFLDTKDGADLHEQKLMEEFNDKIEMKGVGFKYPGKSKFILKNVNLTFNKNKSYLIVGLNGSGKTTLVKLLAKLYTPTNGDIYLDNTNIKEYDSASYMKHISVVFQDFIKYPLSVSENIKIGDVSNLNDNGKMYESANMSGASEFIETLPDNYRTLLQNEWIDGTELSEGQWQKLAITRAVFSKAPIIIMDEPTASLDAISEQDLYKKVSTLIKKKTCVIISHRLTTAHFVDEIIYINDGSVLEQGSFHSLMEKRGKFYELYNIQAEKYRIL